MWGQSSLKPYSKIQGTSAQSSAVSELIAVVKTACEALGSVALAQDLGIDLRVRLHVGAAAALGILESGRRTGSPPRRRCVVDPEQQLCRIVELTKDLGTENPADLMTKHLAQDLVTTFSTVLGYSFRGGRAVTTAQLHVIGEGDKIQGVRTQGEQPKGELLRSRAWECRSPVH